MQRSVVTKSLEAGVADAIATAQTLADAGYLTLVSDPVVLDTQRIVIITSAGDDTGVTFTIIGTDDTGNQIKDQFAGASAGAASSNLNFRTIVSIYADGATDGDVEAGTNSVGSSPWKIFVDTIATPNMSIQCKLVSGSGTATVDLTDDAFLVAMTEYGSQPAIALAPASPNPLAFPHPNMQSMTATTQGSLNFNVRAYRLTITAGTGVWEMTTQQAGLASP